MGLKDIYSSAESKYYNFLDKVNQSIPVYEIIDPIDKVIPSFVLFILLILAMIAGFVLFAFSIFFVVGGNALTVSVMDSDGNPLENAEVLFDNDGELDSLRTDEFGIVKKYDFEEGDLVNLTVEKSGYVTEQKSIVIDILPYAEEIYLDSEEDALETRTIRLVDDLDQPVRESFTLSFTCSNAAASIQSIDLTPQDAGVAQVVVPGNCGSLRVNVNNGSGYEAVFGHPANSDNVKIYLSEQSTGNGEIVVNVQDSQSNPVDGITVELYKNSELLANPNVGPITTDYTFSGQATFSVAAGEYIVKTYDGSGQFGDAESDRIRVGDGETKTVSLTVREEIRGQIKIEVVDKRSGSAIEDAKVKLFYSSNDEQVTELKTGSEGKVAFNISRLTDYKAIASAEGYQLGRLGGLRVSDDDYKIELSRCTPGSCGALKVKVVDQDGDPITNATVALYNASNNFVAGYDTRVSDLNGIARFFGVSPGNYYAYAFKGGFDGRSDSISFSTTAPEQDYDLIVNMDVGEGVVRAVVRDDVGFPISFAKVTVFDARTGERVAEDFTDANGTKEITLKANRQVYLVVEQENEDVYAPYITVQKPIISSSVQEFNVKMAKPILQDDIEAQYAGLFQGSEQVKNVKAGEFYTAKFLLFIPEEEDYDEAGLHLRTGKDVLMEKDKLLIKKVNAPFSSQLKATRFEPESAGLREDDYDQTEGDAKWVNVEWIEPQSAVYEVEAELFIKDGAKLGDRMALHYRAWGENGRRDRFPKDETVTNELYSNTKEEILEIGYVTLCDDDFCFTATITDEEEDIIDSVTDAYSARIFNPYKLAFVINNNSERKIHNNANLRINNQDESLKFFEYEFVTAQTSNVNGVVNGFEFPRLEIGDLRVNDSVRMETSFTPQKALSGIINIKIVSDQVVVFEKNLTIVTGAPKEMNVQVTPTFFSSGIENDVEVLVKDASNDLELEDAIVRLKDKHENVLDYDFTKKDGTAQLTVAGQKPGAKVFVEVEKQNYNVKILELTISEDVLDFTPEQLGVSLNTKNKDEATEILTIRNVAPYDLRIKSVDLKGKFRNLIDKQRVENWLDSAYKGMVIPEGDSREIQLKTYLSEDAQKLNAGINLEGELVIVAENFGQEWLFDVPAKIAIGLGDEVDDPSCLQLTRSEWTASTSGVPKRTEFQIQNNCAVGGRPVALRDLEAKIDWQSNQIGEFTLNFGSEEVPLRGGYFRLMLGTIEAGQTINSILSFTPFGGINGVGEADIVIQATNPLNNENQILQNSLHAKVTSVNIEQCINYDKERVTLNQDETGTITISAGDSCGEPIQFSLDSEINFEPSSEFTLNPGESKAIEIYAEDNNPGQYPLYVEPKFSSETREQLVKKLDIVINAPGCWQLSRYEFDVYDDPENPFDGFDVSRLTNNCVKRPVEVRVSGKDFRDALLDGVAVGIISAIATGLTNEGRGDYNFIGMETDDTNSDKTQQGSQFGAGGDVAGGAGDLIRTAYGTNPLGAFFIGGALTTYYQYQNQPEEVRFTINQTDTAIEDVALVAGNDVIEGTDEDISVFVEGIDSEDGAPEVPMPLVIPPENLLSHGSEVFRTIFTNITGFVTTESRPKYSELKVSGIRQNYEDKVYDKDDFFDDEGGFLGFFDYDQLDKTKSSLDQDEPDELEQRFNLEFNSVPPRAEDVQNISLLNCQDGTRVGATGEDALPKVRFSWKWMDIEENACNEENERGIYCDGTQFTIALMKKINAINEYLLDNGDSLNCPSPTDSAPTESEIGTYDIGVASISTIKSGNEVEVKTRIENTNPGIITTDVEIKLNSFGGGNEISCSEGVKSVTVEAGGTEDVSCNFSGLEEGIKVAVVEITPSIDCENCEDVSATNRLTREFYAGSSGLEECEPYSTTRLASFIAATPGEDDEITDKIRFNATLMADGYSRDFQKDFDVAMRKAFFDASDYYTDNETGLGIYLRDPKLFSFDAYSQPDYHLPGPGTYNVVIDITYGDGSWNLFDSDGNPNAVINVQMEKLKGADPDSPFYYLPINGTVGEDGRIGYGINYAGDSIIFNESVRTVEISGSAPIENGLLRVTESDSFKNMQIDERGVVAKLSRRDGMDLLYQPSNATPVILRIDKQSGDDAYAVYQVGIDGDAIDVGPTMTYWSGIGVSCRAFNDTVMAQQQFIPDTHGINFRCALAGGNERSKYALEFCQEPINFGSVFYQTVFYTPQGSESFVELTGAASDRAVLWGEEIEGQKINLNGNSVTPQINSMQEIFDLVKEEKICISGTNINSEFFWNPKKIFDEAMQQKQNEALDACITG